MGLEEPSFDASKFSKNRERLTGEDMALRFFDAVVREARAQELLSDEHFGVDGALIEAWASMNRAGPRTAVARGPTPAGTGTSNASGAATRQASTMDPEAKLLRNALGKEGKLCDVNNVSIAIVAAFYCARTASSKRAVRSLRSIATTPLDRRALPGLPSARPRTERRRPGSGCPSCLEPPHRPARIFLVKGAQTS